MMLTMRREIAGWVLLVLTWGSTWSVIRFGLRDLPAFTGAALRFGLAGLLLLGLALARREPLGRTPVERRLWLVQAVLTFTIPYGTIYWAERVVPSGLTSVLFATFTFFVAGFAHWLLPGERLRGATVAGILLGFTGVTLLFWDDLTRLGGARLFPVAFIVLLAPFSSGLSQVLIKRWGQGVSVLSLTAVPMLLGASLLGLVAVLAEQPARIHWTAAAVGSVLYLAVLGSAVSFLVYFWLLQRMTATGLSFLSYLTPVVALIVGAIVLDETLSSAMLAGIATIFAGLALVLRSRPRSPRGG